jgi:tripartite-type tricarboxylate transporter receptor subunit TctC
MTTGMSRRRFVAAAPMLATAAVAFGPAWAAAYPDRPITLVAPFAPGGIVDIVARALAPSLSETIGQSVVVVNKAGASGIIGNEFVAHSPPNGYRLAVTGNADLLMGAAIYENLPFNVRTDFEPVSKLVTGSNMIVVRANSSIKTMQDFLAYCKAHPDKATFASVAPIDWLVGSLFAQKTGLKFTRVPYKSTADADLAVAAGQILFALPPASVVARGGNSVGVNALATIGPKRDPRFPDVQTLDELGVQGISVNVWIGLFAPAKTPEAVIAKINSSVNQALIQPKVKELFGRVDLTPTGNTVKAFGQEVVHSLGFWKKVAKEAGISIKL